MKYFKSPSESLPPRIQWRVSSGSSLLGRGGELVVSPGARLVLDCIFSRAAGTPEWEWENRTKEFPTGWATSTLDRDWLYRLELEGVRLEDSGEYRCTGVCTGVQVYRVCTGVRVREVTPTDSSS